MASEVPTIQNSKMLLLSLGLAAVVVVLYNVHINQIRNADKNDMVKLLQYKLDRKAGDRLTDKDDIEVVEVNRKIAEGLRSVYTEDLRPDVVGKTLSRPVTRGKWILIDDLNEARKDRPSESIPAGFVAVALPLDSTRNLGELLRMGDRVNVLGELPGAGGQYTTTHIVDGLVVCGIGGRMPNENAARQGSQSYREIQVLVKKPVSRELHNVLSYVRGQTVWIELRNPLDPPGEMADGEINPSLDKRMRDTAANVGRGGAAFVAPGGGGSDPSPMSN